MAIPRIAARLTSKANHTIVNALTVWLAEVYGSPRAWVRRFGTRPLYELRRRLQHDNRRRGLSMAVMQGTLPGQTQPVRVGVLTDSSELDYAQAVIFEESEVCREMRGKVRLGDLGPAAHSLAAETDLVFVERSSLDRWLPETGAWVLCPSALRMVYDYTPGQSWPEFEKSFRKQNVIIRRVKASGFTCRVSHSPEDLEFFYNHMYAPMVQERHSDYGTTDTLAAVQAEFKRAHLLLVEDSAGQPISGAINQVLGNMLVGKYIGVLDGRRDLMQAGAMSALYYFSLKIGHERGLRRFDAGRVAPLARHGIYTYKRRWNLRPIPDLWNNRDWLFWVPTGSEAALGWLEEHPLVPEFTRTSAGRLQASYQAMREEGI